MALRWGGGKPKSVGRWGAELLDCRGQLAPFPVEMTVQHHAAEADGLHRTVDGGGCQLTLPDVAISHRAGAHVACFEQQLPRR